MDVNIEKNTLNIPDDEFVVDFEVKKTPVRLGKSDRYFYMDFNDTNFPVRLKKGREEIAEFLESKRDELGVDNINEIRNNEPTLEDVEKSIRITDEIDEFVKSKVNYIFGYDVSSVVFGVASSVSVTRNGEYYFDNFLNSILPLVEREYQVRMSATNERIKKYTDRKGMHPALKK